jgi:hypothetical protein
VTVNDPTARLLRDAENYLSALHGSVARHDNLAANLSCAGCELRDRLGVELRAVSSAAPPADRAELRDRIRRAVCEASGFAWDSDMLEPDEYGEVADAVLAVLPAPADRAAILQEAATRLEADMERFFAEWPDEPRNSPYALGRKDAATELRRVADEAQQPETQADDGAETARAMLFWDTSTGASLSDGRITIPVSKAANLAEFTPAGELILQLPAASALRSTLTALLTEAYEAQRGAEPKPCTCADAGDCFAPAGHHVDCPQADESAAAQQPKEARPSPTEELLVTPCDACRHTLNRHFRHGACTVVLCVCGTFQYPADEEPTP